MSLFGNWQKTTRLDRGLTQDGLAELSGISRAYISEIERGGNPSLFTVEIIVGALGHKLWEVFKEINL